MNQKKRIHRYSEPNLKNKITVVVRTKTVCLGSYVQALKDKFEKGTMNSESDKKITKSGCTKSDSNKTEVNLVRKRINSFNELSKTDELDSLPRRSRTLTKESRPESRVERNTSYKVAIQYNSQKKNVSSAARKVYGTSEKFIPKPTKPQKPDLKSATLEHKKPLGRINLVKIKTVPPPQNVPPNPKSTLCDTEILCPIHSQSQNSRAEKSDEEIDCSICRRNRIRKRSLQLLQNSLGNRGEGSRQGLPIKTDTKAGGTQGHQGNEEKARTIETNLRYDSTSQNVIRDKKDTSDFEDSIKGICRKFGKEYVPKEAQKNFSPKIGNNLAEKTQNEDKNSGEERQSEQKEPPGLTRNVQKAEPSEPAENQLDPSSNSEQTSGGAGEASHEDESEGGTRTSTESANSILSELGGRSTPDPNKNEYTAKNLNLVEECLEAINALRSKILDDRESGELSEKPHPKRRTKVKTPIEENSSEIESELKSPETDSGYYSGNQILEHLPLDWDSVEDVSSAEYSLYENVPNVRVRTMSERQSQENLPEPVVRSISVPLPPKSEKIKQSLSKAPNFEENLHVVSRTHKEDFIPLKFDNVLYHLIETVPKQTPKVEPQEAVLEAVNHVLIRKLQVPEVDTETVKRRDSNRKDIPVIRYSKVFEHGKETITILDNESNPVIKDVDLRAMTKYQTVPEKKSRRSNERKSDEKIRNSGPKECTMMMLNIIKEIKDTEKTYLKSLKVIVEEYLPMIDFSNIPKGLAGKKNLIFSNISQIYQCHLTSFLSEINQCDDIKRMANCFLKHKHLFEMYPEYCRNERKGDKLANEYNSFFMQKQRELNDPFNLASYLLIPVQRLGKYILLLKSLKNECDKNKFHVVELKQALSMLQYNMNRGNDLISLDDIENCKMSLNDLGALELRDEFSVWANPSKSPLDAMVFFFEHAIVLTGIKREDNTETYWYHDHIAIRDLGYTKMQENPIDFEIWLRRRDQKISYILRAKSPKEKEVWDKLITTKLWDQLKESRKKCPNIKNVEFIPITVRAEVHSEILEEPERERMGSTHSLKSQGRNSKTSWYTK